jgi:hypothetical protein
MLKLVLPPLAAGIAIVSFIYFDAVSTSETDHACLARSVASPICYHSTWKR